MRYYVITDNNGLPYEITKETADKVRVNFPNAVITDSELRDYLAARRERMIHS